MIYLWSSCDFCHLCVLMPFGVHNLIILPRLSIEILLFTFSCMAIYVLKILSIGITFFPLVLNIITTITSSVSLKMGVMNVTTLSAQTCSGLALTFSLLK